MRPEDLLVFFPPRNYKIHQGHRGTARVASWNPNIRPNKAECLSQWIDIKKRKITRDEESKTKSRPRFKELGSINGKCDNRKWKIKDWKWENEEWKIKYKKWREKNGKQKLENEEWGKNSRRKKKMGKSEMEGQKSRMRSYNSENSNQRSEIKTQNSKIKSHRLIRRWRHHHLLVCNKCDGQEVTSVTYGRTNRQTHWRGSSPPKQEPRIRRLRLGLRSTTSREVADL